MSKAIGLLLAVCVIWVTVEIYTQGVDGAFGGRLAPWIGGSGASHEPRGTTAERVGQEIGRAHEEHEARYNELLPE